MSKLDAWNSQSNFSNFDTLFDQWVNYYNQGGRAWCLWAINAFSRCLDLSPGDVGTLYNLAIPYRRFWVTLHKEINEGFHAKDCESIEAEIAANYNQARKFIRNALWIISTTSTQWFNDEIKEMNRLLKVIREDLQYFDMNMFMRSGQWMYRKTGIDPND